MILLREGTLRSSEFYSRFFVSFPFVSSREDLVERMVVSKGGSGDDGVLEK